jgi:hypothetical protein
MQETALTVNHPPPPAEDGAESRPNVADALRTLQTFSRKQVAWLMSTAMRWGYELRVDEENGAYPPAPIFNGWDTGEALDQRAYRAACDRAARVPRISDHQGGPVEAWGDDDQGVQVAA